MLFSYAYGKFDYGTGKEGAKMLRHEPIIEDVAMIMTELLDLQAEDKLPILTIDTIPQMRGVQLVTGNWNLIKLGAINFVIFPDWQQDEESLCQDLAQVISTIITQPESSQISLFIDIANTSEDEANLILSSVTMNLLMAEDWDVAEAPEISFDQPSK